jgi:hypothetical protein
MVNLRETSVPVPGRGVEGMLGLEEFIEAIRPWMDQAHFNFVVCDPELRMLYINPFTLNNLRALLENMKRYSKAARELTHIKGVVGMDTGVFHRHPNLKEHMLEKEGDYEKSYRQTTKVFPADFRAIRDADGEILGWVGSWDVEEGEPDEDEDKDNLMIYGSATINVDPEPKK